jgi:UDP-glucose-4-epimerase GalE
MKNVLVTGGAGYVGSHTAKALAQAGYRPVVLDDLSMGHKWAVKWGPFEHGSIQDEAFVRGVLERYQIEAVLHFAANAYVGESMHNPSKYFRNNVCHTLALLNAVLASGVRKFVFSSTCATYGIPRAVPIAEHHPQSPVNPYGESKLFIEKVLRWYRESHDLRSVCLRYFNAAGADPEGEIGEDHTPETHLIPLVILSALGDSGTMPIFGSDYPTPDGTAVRDYVHVSDLADAHVRALSYLANGGESTALNIGTGKGYSVREVVETVQRVAGRKVPVKIKARRRGDPAILIAQPDSARDVLGWQPRFTNLEESIGTAWHWHVSQRSQVASAMA